MPLFNYDKRGVMLHSGGKSNYLIDCNALSDDDLKHLAAAAAQVLGRYRWVLPVLRGGLRFANALVPHVYGPDCSGVLIVDDVWTTGNSIQEARSMLRTDEPCDVVVIFARGETPPGVVVAGDLWMKAK